MQRYIRHEIAYFRQNGLLPNGPVSGEHARDPQPQIGEHRQNDLTVIGKIFAEIIEQHEEVYLSLNRIVSLPLPDKSAVPYDLGG